jgi:4-diphosphocytidyl-2-C-methyl-D-erythritol kinase
VIVFPNAKINLGLQVTGKRPDGYHDISTIFYPLPVCDILEAIRAEEFSFHTSGLTIDAPAQGNLCIKAYQLLQRDFSLPAVAMHLHKVIPMGAGLGGGSSDGAFTLMLLNRMFNLGLTREQLLGYALQLGSDCPFFIMNEPCFAGGRGEVMEPIQLPSLKNKLFLIVNPGLHINTAWAFSQLKIREPKIHLRDVVALPPDQWRDLLVNDFEEVAFEKHAELIDIRSTLYRMGAVFAGMTGTGSTMFGIFDSAPAGYRTAFPSHYFTILQSND